jgi:hypothetical protein
MDAGQTWRQQREQLNRKVDELQRQGICDTCYDLETGEPYGNRHVVYEDDLFRVKAADHERRSGCRAALIVPPGLTD